MTPPCPKCLDTDKVDRDGNEGFWFCGRGTCLLLFTGHPHEQHHYAERERKQEAHKAELARQALAQVGKVEPMEDVA